MMRDTMSKAPRFVQVGRLLPLIACACFIFPAANHSALAQAVTEQPIVVTGEEVPSAYGAPPGLSRSRFSNTTQVYVLPPWAFFFGEIYEGQGFRHGPPDHLFTQEIEMGLPYRFGVAAEAKFERFNGGGGAETVSLEARWALADWNKIPLNPTLFAEYKFGVGTIRHEERPPPAGGGEEEEEEGGPPKVPDAYEFRLLLANVFVVFSWLFGGERAEAEAPVSTRFRYYSDVAYSHSGKDSGKEMKQVALAPCPQWYGDFEWNVNLFGTYAFTNTEYNPNVWLVDVVQSTSEGNPVLGTYDRYVGGDHAWGGGGDIKYFFHGYVGVGIEGFAWVACIHV